VALDLDAPALDAADDPPRTGSQGPMLATLAGLFVVVVGLRIGLQPLGDNSFLTHLATGRLILERGSVPTSDPYSFTAEGTPWVVQSWLVSLWFAGLEQLGGLRAIQLATGVVTAGLALVIWRLSRRAEGLLARLFLVALALVNGAMGWSERPYLYGLLALALVLLAAEGDLRPGWLIPVCWLWANAHGTFVFGLAVLVVLALGRRADGSSSAVEVRALKCAAIGIVLAVVNPLGPRLLLFPFSSMSKREELDGIIEWQAPRFTDWGQRAFLILVVVAICALVRRPSWRAGLPVAIFTALALIAARNVVVASLVLVPAVAASFGDLGGIRGATRWWLGRVLAAVILVFGALTVVVGTSVKPLVTAMYPVEALSWLRSADGLGPDSRVIAPDFVGNWLELHEPQTKVFIDDRADMYPGAVVEDLEALMGGKPEWSEVLRRWEATAVVWRVQDALAQLLELSPEWRIAYRDDDWVVALPA
jgi:hypothetical protein